MPSIRIATLNLWNTDHLRIERLHVAAEELTRLDADVVALQEVRSRVTANSDSSTDAATHLSGLSGHKHVAFQAYRENPGEGLAFPSKHPVGVAELESEGLDSFALRGSRSISTGLAWRSPTCISTMPASFHESTRLSTSWAPSRARPAPSDTRYCSAISTATRNQPSTSFWRASNRSMARKPYRGMI